VQSLILASLCITIGTLLYMMGLIGDLVATNRKLLERLNVRLHSMALGAQERRHEGD
jgi:hypothetical protein